MFSEMKISSLKGLHDVVPIILVVPLGHTILQLDITFFRDLSEGMDLRTVQVQ